MKLKPLAATVALAILPGIAMAAPLASDEDKLSYSVGVTVGENLKVEFPELKAEAILAGLGDALKGQELQLSDEQIEALMLDLQQKRLAEQQKRMEEQLAKFAQEKTDNQNKGDQFLAENAKKDGVVQTESGLQYKVLSAGKGDRPAADAVVTVDYEGRLLDGTVFDSSYERGEPIEFPLNRVIAGWTEGLQLMNAGSAYELYIPAGLAYGERGAPPKIGPNEVLIFKVELKSFKPQVAASE